MLQLKPTIAFAAIISIGSICLATARFLESSTTPKGAALASSTNILFNSALSCGECILGGYTYCINAMENYTGTAIP